MSINAILAVGIVVFMIFAFGYAIGYGHCANKMEEQKKKIYASKKS